MHYVDTVPIFAPAPSAGLADSKLKVRLADLGSSVFIGSPSAFGKHISEETEKWAKVIRAARIKVE